MPPPIWLEDRYLAVQDQRGRGQGGDRRRKLGEPPGVIEAIPTDQPHLIVGLVGQKPLLSGRIIAARVTGLIEQDRGVIRAAKRTQGVDE